MSNSISFLGRLGADAELKQVGDNTVLEFRVANNTGFGDRQITNWFRCTLWGKRGQSLEQYLNKGKQVFVIGELSMRPFTGRDGSEKMSADVRVHEINFVSDNNRQQEGSESSAPSYGAPSPSPAPASSSNDEEDLPF